MRFGVAGLASQGSDMASALSEPPSTASDADSSQSATADLLPHHRDGHVAAVPLELRFDPAWSAKAKFKRSTDIVLVD